MSLASDASPALVASLIDDPFYQAITEDFGTDVSAREQALASYFRYSLDEAERTGVVSLLLTPGSGPPPGCCHETPKLRPQNLRQSLSTFCQPLALAGTRTTIEWCDTWRHWLRQLRRPGRGTCRSSEYCRQRRAVVWAHDFLQARWPRPLPPECHATGRPLRPGPWGSTSDWDFALSPTTLSPSRTWIMLSCDATSESGSTPLDLP